MTQETNKNGKNNKNEIKGRKFVWKIRSVLVGKMYQCSASGIYKGKSKTQIKTEIYTLDFTEMGQTDNTTSFPGSFPWLGGGAGKDPGIGR